MRHPLFIHAKRYCILPAFVVLFAGAARGETPGDVYGGTAGEAPVARQGQRSYPAPAPAHQFDHDTILKWFIMMSPREQRKIGHWEHKAITNEHQLRHTEILYLKRLLRDDFFQRKQAIQQKKREDNRQAVRHREARKRQMLELARGPLD